MNSLRFRTASTRIYKPVVGIIGFVSILLLAGCTVGPNYRRPTAEVPATYKEVGDWKPAQPNDQNIGGNWWELFQDSQLNALEKQVDVSNQNLKAAQAQYTQARALVRYSRADLFPTVTAGASAARSRTSFDLSVRRNASAQFTRFVGRTPGLTSRSVSDARKSSHAV